MARQIIFLCTGNICRSPLAEVLALKKFGSLGSRFCSAGLEAGSGWPASQSSVDYAAANGMVLENHSSQPVTPELLTGTSWVIGLTRSHAAIFRSRWRDSYTGAIGILGAPGVDLAQLTHSPAAEEVDDPYGLSADNYNACGDQIDRLLEGWAATFTALQGTSQPGSGQETQS